MKRVKKILLGAMVAVIIFSISSGSTYSAFTSSATSNSNVFQTGTFKVMLSGDVENSMKMLNLNYDKFGAGDSMSRDFYIKNCGSLPFTSKLSFSDESNPLFNYLLCEVNIYYKGNMELKALECKQNMYSGTLSDFDKSAMIIQYRKGNSATIVSELTPSESLRCEIILTLPEDVTLPNEAFKLPSIKQANYISNVQNSNEVISIKIDATQIDNPSLK